MACWPRDFLQPTEAPLPSVVARRVPCAVSAAFRLTPRIASRGGYQLLWINDVALAGDNASRSLLNPSLLAGSVGATGDVVYHGATAAIDFAW